MALPTPSDQPSTTFDRQPASVGRQPAPSDRQPAPSDRRPLPPTRAAAERGLPGWGALTVFLLICGVGGLIDVLNGSKVRGAFNVAIVLAAIVAILLVRRGGMFPIVVAPPLVYLVASVLMLLVRGGISNRQAIYDEATNWLVYGFPAIAAATAAALLIAGVRLIIKR